MWYNNLRIVHTGVPIGQGRQEKVGYFLWQTCLRSIYISDARILPHQSEADLKKVFSHKYRGSYEGYQAYTFLLEVVLGLHSDLLGETEVSHQFRNAFQNKQDFLAANVEPNILDAYLKKLCADITVDVRKIRSQHMHGLGEMSYGGVARRFLKGKQHITVFGSGQLANDLIPWLAKESQQLLVVGRNAKRLQDLEKCFGILTCHYESLTVDSFFSHSALVIAAPLPFEPYLCLIKRGMYILDFRSQVQTQLPDGVEYYPLQKIMQQIRQSKAKRQQLFWQIKPVIEKIIQERKQKPYQVVHGWAEATHLQVL